MKKLLTLCCCLITLTLAAQTQTVLLAEDYADGVVYLKNGLRVRVPLNYDAGLHRMRYKQKGEVMELQNIEDVDSIVFSARRFVPFGGRFCECFPSRHSAQDVLLVDWSMQRHHIGYKGVMGNVSQVKGQSVNIATMSNILGEMGGTVNDPITIANANRDTAGSQDVYRLRYANTYYILRDGKAKKIKDKKSLMRAFPDKTAALEGAMKTYHIDFAAPQTVIDVILEIL